MEIKIYEVSPEEVFVAEDRHRQRFDRKPLDELIESIRALGQIQPGVCFTNEAGQLELLVGERRLRACTVLKTPFRYWLKEEISDPLILEQIQLDENLCREDLDWKEDLIAKERLHKLLQERFGAATPGRRGGHGYADTAEHIGIKKTTLAEDVLLAGYLRFPEVAAAPNKATAKTIVKRLQEQVVRQQKLFLLMKGADGEQIKEPLTDAAQQEVVKQTEQATAIAATSKEDTEKFRLQQQLAYFSRRCFEGMMEEKLESFKESSLDILFFDPPWGVDFANVYKSSGATQSYEDYTETDFNTKLNEWLTLLLPKMKENSHFYMFGAIANAATIYDILESHGLIVDRIPLIWWKKGAHYIRQPHLWPGRSYEPIFFAHKGGKKPLVRLGKPNVIETPMPTTKIKGIHPSAKHPSVYLELLLRSAEPGDTILDPMAGSGMLGVAAESISDTHQLNWFMIEQDSNFYQLQLYNLMRGYFTIIGDLRAPAIEAEEPKQSEQAVSLKTPESFETLTPGTDLWKAYWKAHPEQQDAMLAYQKSKTAKS